MAAKSSNSSSNVDRIHCGQSLKPEAEASAVSDGAIAGKKRSQNGGITKSGAKSKSGSAQGVAPVIEIKDKQAGGDKR